MERSRTTINRSVFVQLYLGIIANLTCLAPSMSLGFSAIALPALTDSSNPNALTKDQASWMASIAAICTPIGCILSGAFLDKYGRKNTLYLVNICTFVGWSLISIAYETKDYQYVLLLIGRCFTGISTGMASMPATVYITEITTAKYRGMFSTWTTVFFSLGVLGVYTLGFLFRGNWGLISLIISGIPCVVLFLTIAILPESPTWLVNRNKLEDATINLCKLYRVRDYDSLAVRQELELLSRHDQSKNLNLRNKIRHLAKPVCYKPLIIITMFFFFQQFSGTFAILFYSVSVVQSTGVDMDPFSISVYIGLIRCFGCVFMTFTTKRYGRRIPSIVSGGGMAISMLSLSIFLYSVEDKSNYQWVSILLMLVYFFINTIGFLSMPFAMAAEVFPTTVRGLASGLAVCSGYIFNFIAVKIYPDMIDLISIKGVFCFYGIVALVGTILVLIFLPETKGKTLKEIEEYFSSNKSNVNRKTDAQLSTD